MDPILIQIHIEAKNIDNGEPTDIPRPPAAVEKMEDEIIIRMDMEEDGNGQDPDQELSVGIVVSEIHTVHPRFTLRFSFRTPTPTPIPIPPQTHRLSLRLLIPLTVPLPVHCGLGH